MLSLCRAAVIAAVALANTSAFAFTLKGVPAHIVGGAELKLTPFGNLTAINLKVAGALNDIQSTINAAVPQIEAAMRCDRGQPFELSNLSIWFGPRAGFFGTATNPPLMASAAVRECKGWVSGNIIASMPVTATASGGAVKLGTGPLMLDASGVVLVRLVPVPVPQSIENWFAKRVQPQFTKIVQTTEALINNFVLKTALQKQIRITNRKIESVQFTASRGALSVQMEISGQATAAALDGYLPRKVRDF
jgi:hypothetical protein